LFYNRDILPHPVRMDGYILRLQRDEHERQLYAKRSLYVGIRRDWGRGTQILFAKKDSFIGSGVIDRVVDLEDMNEDEKKLCLENNWYAKIVFAKLARFYPPVPVQDTPAKGLNQLALHGAEVDASAVIALARARITT
jgi:hypothetical protein